MLLVRVGKYHKYISLKAKRKIKFEKMTGHEGACFDYTRRIIMFFCPINLTKVHEISSMLCWCCS